MFKKRQRLSTKEFNLAFTTGRRFHTPYFQAILKPSSTFHGAVVVGKKVYKHATERNRLRRRVYGVMYRHLTRDALPYTIILIAKPPLTSVPRREITNLVVAILKCTLPR